MNEVKKITLQKPIRFGDDVIAELDLREPTAGDFRGLVMRTDGAIDMDTMLTLAGRSCGHPPSVIDKLGCADLMQVLAVVGGFIGGGPRIGT